MLGGPNLPRSPDASSPPPQPALPGTAPLPRCRPPWTSHLRAPPGMPEPVLCSGHPSASPQTPAPRTPLSQALSLLPHTMPNSLVRGAFQPGGIAGRCKARTGPDCLPHPPSVTVTILPPEHPDPQESRSQAAASEGLHPLVWEGFAKSDQTLSFLPSWALSSSPAPAWSLQPSGRTEQCRRGRPRAQSLGSHGMIPSASGQASWIIGG